MTDITYSQHASTRMQQRGIRKADIPIILAYGTQIDDETYLMRKRDANREIENGVAPLWVDACAGAGYFFMLCYIPKLANSLLDIFPFKPDESPPCLSTSSPLSLEQLTTATLCYIILTTYSLSEDMRNCKGRRGFRLFEGA